VFNIQAAKREAAEARRKADEADKEKRQVNRNNERDVKTRM
jgi:hypothetical protein